ncbi:MAG: DNA recombination protein RmuC, partial [Pirellulaceae bacterium]
ESVASAATERAEKKALDDKLLEQEKNLGKLQEQFRLEFENVANKLLEEKSKKFTELNKQKMEDLLKPLGENIDAFRKKVEETHEKATKQNVQFSEQLKSLGTLHTQMSADAQNLTSALKGESQVRGAWGEMILERLLEDSGLKKGPHYKVQQSYEKDGSQHRPDVVIYMPENRSLVVDSKVSLVAYDQYCTADDEEARARALKAHVDAIRKHVKELSGKNYQSLYELEGLDFVLMFIPIEPAFLLAAQSTLDPKTSAPDLFSESFDLGVALVTTSTLLISLKTIESTWRREDQNRNALAIAKEGGAMLNKFADFVKDLEDIGKRLRMAGESYEAARNKLVSGRGNLVRRAEKMKALGAKSTKALPESMVVAADDVELPLIESTATDEQDG